MTGENALLTTAEVAVAFAGFASVVTVFRRREHGDWTPQDVLRFQLMITASLSVVFFSLLPLAISFFGASESHVWSYASGTLALYLAFISALVTRRMLSMATSAPLSPLISWPFLAIGIVAIALLALNSFGSFFERELGPYFAALFYLLVVAGISFARMLPIRVHSDG